MGPHINKDINAQKHNKMKTKYTHISTFVGELNYLENGGLRVANKNTEKTFSASEMQEISNAYKGANRIHKPIALLFWSDCKNGLHTNWK